MMKCEFLFTKLLHIKAKNKSTICVNKGGSRSQSFADDEE